MTHFLLYWRPETVENHAPDQILWWAGSKQIKEKDIRPGDIVWSVTSPPQSGELRLVARIAVERIVHSRGEAVALVGETAWRDAEHFVIGREDEGRPKQDIDLTDVAFHLEFDSSDPGRRRLKRDVSFGQSLQTIRTLTAATAGLFQRAWDAGGVSKPPRFIWQKDELILALDLYMRLNRIVPDDTHPEVEALSVLLRTLPIHTDRGLDPVFRNPNGVALKLANFRAIEQPGRGMSRGNRLEQVVWDEFAGDEVRLRQIAVLIAAGVVTEMGQEQIAPQDEEEAFPEGRIAFRLHRYRERNQELVRRKKAQVRKATGQLRCEACLFDFETIYGERGKDFIECHHTIPVSQMPEDAKTKLEDLVLVCSNCHRMIHRQPWVEGAELHTLIKAVAL